MIFLCKKTCYFFRLGGVIDSNQMFAYIMAAGPIANENCLLLKTIVVTKNAKTQKKGANVIFLGQGGSKLIPWYSQWSVIDPQKKTFHSTGVQPCPPPPSPPLSKDFRFDPRISRHMTQGNTKFIGLVFSKRNLWFIKPMGDSIKDGLWFGRVKKIT